jgi:uncharacterized membrane protein
MQYFVIALIAGVGAFVTSLPSEAHDGEIAVAVNIHEAWINYKPVLCSWLIGFAFLAFIKFLIFYSTHHKQNNSK